MSARNGNLERSLHLNSDRRRRTREFAVTGVGRLGRRVLLAVLVVMLVTMCMAAGLLRTR